MSERCKVFIAVSIYVFYSHDLSMILFSVNLRSHVNFTNPLLSVITRRYFAFYNIYITVVLTFVDQKGKQAVSVI